jgi:hypothetical protein
VAEQELLLWIKQGIHPLVSLAVQVAEQGTVCQLNLITQHQQEQVFQDKVIQVVRVMQFRGFLK